MPKLEYQTIYDELSSLGQGMENLDSVFRNIIIDDIRSRFDATYTNWKNLHEYLLNYTSVIVETFVHHVDKDAEMREYMEIWGAVLIRFRFGI